MKLSIIVVSWNVRDLLEKCLQSIFEQTRNINFEILVVDNGSTDGTAEMILKKFPQVNLIRSTKNLGFAAGNNLALRSVLGSSQSEFILLLNPDTEIINSAIEKMVDLMRREPEAGITGPKLLNADRSLQPSVRRFPTFLDQLFILFKVTHFWLNSRVLKHYWATDFDYLETAEVDQVMGAFFLVRREVFERIGLFDEKFFLWFEEVDFCRRAKQAGYRIIYYPGAEVIHYGGQSFKQRWTLRKQWWFLKSLIYYFWKTARHSEPPKAGSERQ